MQLYLHDNLGILGSSRSEVVGVIERSKVQLNSKNLLLHEVEAQSGRAKTLSMVLDCERFMTMNSWERFGRIRKSIQHILNQRRAFGWVLEVVWGHCT